MSGPVEGPGVTAASPTRVRSASGLGRRRGARAADALADAVAAPAFRTGRDRPARRGRRVTRIVRRIELWSVLKIALVFNTIMLGVALGTVALLWGLANTTGVVDDLEGFLRDAGFEDFRFQGERMFEQVAFIGAVAALAATVFMVLAAALLNLISEITGGIKLVVIEEIVEPSASPGSGSASAAPAPQALPTLAPAPAPQAPTAAPSPAPAPVPAPPTVRSTPAPAPPGPNPAARPPAASPAPFDAEAGAVAEPASEAPAARPAKKPAAKKRPAKKAAPRKVSAKKAAPATGAGDERPPSRGGRQVRRADARTAPVAETDGGGDNATA